MLCDNAQDNGETKASESEWSNQRQEDSISYKKLLPEKQCLGTIPRNAS